MSSSALSPEEESKLQLRERAIARGEDLLSNKIDNAVAQKLIELEIDPQRIDHAAKVYKTIVGQYPTALGKAVSKKERENKELENTTLVYGEIQFKTFALAIEKIKDKYKGLRDPGGLFVDIGSGIGKPLFAALLMHEFDKVLGIEILQGLHDISQELLDIWYENKDALDISPKTRKTAIEMVCGDFLEVDWSNADLAFCNSTCFDDDLMNKVSEKAELMKPGSFFISFTRRLKSDKWQVLEYERHLMSWGDATVFISQRKEDEIPTTDPTE